VITNIRLRELQRTAADAAAEPWLNYVDSLAHRDTAAALDELIDFRRKMAELANQAWPQK